jgi:peroxiredoxin
MAELGQLERRHEDFDKHNTRVVVVSVEGIDDAQKTHERFPDLLVLSDEKHGLTDAVKVTHPHAGPGDADIDAPTTIWVDRKGIVRWLYRSDSVASRLSPDEVLQAVDQYLSAQP